LLLYLFPSLLLITALSIFERLMPLSWSISSWFGVLFLNTQAAVWGMFLAKAVLFLRLSIGQTYQGKSRPWISGALAVLAAILFLKEIVFHWTLMSVSIVGFFMLSSLKQLPHQRLHSDPLLLVMTFLICGFLGYSSMDVMIPFLYDSFLLREAFLTPQDFTRGLVWSQITPLGTFVAPVYWGLSSFSWLGMGIGIMAVMLVPLSWFSFGGRTRDHILSLEVLKKLGFGFSVGLGVLWIFSLLDMLLVMNWPPQSFFVALLSAALFVRKWNSLKIISVGFIVALTQLLAEALASGGPLDGQI
jgi:hypothetical protein